MISCCKLLSRRGHAELQCNNRHLIAAMGLFTGSLLVRTSEMLVFYCPQFYSKYCQFLVTSDSLRLAIKENIKISNIFSMTMNPINRSKSTELSSQIKSNTPSIRDDDVNDRPSDFGITSNNDEGLGSSNRISASNEGKAKRGVSLFLYNRNAIRSIENINMT